MPMEPSPLVPQDFQGNPLHHHPSSGQHQGINCCNPEIPSQVQQAAHPFINQHTIMPSQGSPGVEAAQLPSSQESYMYAEGSWHPLQQNIIPRQSEQGAQSLSRAPCPSPEQDYTKALLQPSQRATFSGFTPESAPNLDQFRGPYEQCYSKGNSLRLSTEFTSHQPFNSESHVLHNNRRRRFFPQNLRSPGQIGINCSGAVMEGGTESTCLGMRSVGQLKVQPCHPEYLEAPTRSFSTMPYPVAPSNSQGLSFRPEAHSQDINFIRKLRQRERSYGGNWKSKRRIHGKRNQQDMDEDSCSLPPCKQFMSEEKMATRMSNLSIKNDNKMATLQEKWLQAKMHTKRQLEEIESRLSDSESDVESDFDSKNVRGDANSQHRQLQVSPELRTALRQQGGLLPDFIVKSMANASNQLVLWKPPSSFIGDVINASSNQGEASKDQSHLQSPDSMNPSVKEAPTLCTMEEGARPTQAMHSGIERPIGGNSTPSGLTASANELFDCMDDDMDLQ